MTIATMFTNIFDAKKQFRQVNTKACSFNLMNRQLKTGNLRKNAAHPKQQTQNKDHVAKKVANREAEKKRKKKISARAKRMPVNRIGDSIHNNKYIYITEPSCNSSYLKTTKV